MRPRSHAQTVIAIALACSMIFLGAPAPIVAQQQAAAQTATEVAPGDIELNLLSPVGDAYGDGIDVRLIDQDGNVVASGTSDELGRVAFQGVEEGEYFLGIGQGRVPLTVSTGSNYHRLNVVATPSQLGMTYPSQLPDYAGEAGATAGGTSPTVMWTVVAVGAFVGVAGLTVGIIALARQDANADDIEDLEERVRDLEDAVSP